MNRPDKPTAPTQARAIVQTLNMAAVHAVSHRAFLIVLLSGREVTEERVWSVAEPMLASNVEASMRDDLRASIQDVLTSAEMLRGGSP